MATAADSTHPTGMHSCLIDFLFLKGYQSLGLVLSEFGPLCLGIGHALWVTFSVIVYRNLGVYYI